MKTKYLVLGAIFAFLSLGARSQVYEMYYQGFESGEEQNYTVSPASGASMTTTIYKSGSRSLKLTQTSSQDIEVVLDTLDFTQNTTLRYIALTFDHICRVPINPNNDNMMATLYYKRANQSSWTQMMEQDYNQENPIHASFTTQAFSENSYTGDPQSRNWRSQVTPTVGNDQWHSERFDLDNVITPSVPTSERKLLIKLVLHYRSLTTPLDATNTAWWIDNIKVNASAERMRNPKVTMVDYPNMDRFPNSRGARLELNATTTVTAGINPDSVYALYTIGADATEYREPMTPVAGVPGNYECRLPFGGYDTTMRFRCVVRDASGNQNTATFPSADNSWVTFRSVRGATQQPGVRTPNLEGTSNEIATPFPGNADHKAEYVIDSAMMAEAGYGPGAITSIKMKLATNIASPWSRTRFQVKMKNERAGYLVEPVGSNYYYTTDFMRVVYDSAITIPALSAGLEYTLALKDTFFYAGQDIVMQISYDGNAEDTPISVKSVSTLPTQQSMITYNLLAQYGTNVFTLQNTQMAIDKHPAFVFDESPIQPLLYDAGVSELVDPNFTVPMTVRPGSLTVKIKNYGALPFTAARISYSIDDTLNGHFDWTGNLAAGEEATVMIANSTINIPAGYHTLRAWVEDSVTAGGQLRRDHEPYNDTSFSEFIVCDGPMGGVRNIGGTNANFNSIEEFLFSLSRCGINDSLIVRLAPGCYPAFTMPAVNGLSGTNYIVFKPQGTGRVILFADSTQAQASIVNLESVHNMRFRDLYFVRRNGALDDMVKLGVASVDCRFEGCSFIDSLPNPPASLRIGALLNSGYANNMLVDSCTFVGGRIGVDIKGEAPDIRSNGNVVRRSTFNDQYENAVKAENQNAVTIVDNEMYDVYSNSTYVVQLSECYGATSLERNKVYTSHGAGAIGLNNVIGTDSNRAIIANNMLVGNDDGTANLMRPVLNVIQGAWVDVVYNSVKMTAPTRANTAAATFGGSSIENCRFMNNVVVTMDNTNYALGYMPLSSTTNHVSHNVYFTNGNTINRKSGAAYSSLAAWQTAVPEDSTSVVVNPNFLNGSLVDLRTYNRALKGVAQPLPSVPTDMFGTTRGDSVACPGAFEFSSLPYDFEIEALLSPSQDTCNMPLPVELVVRMRNSGVNPFIPDSSGVLSIAYRLNNGTTTLVSVNQVVPAEDTVTIHTGHTLNMPSGSFVDATYTLKVWNSFAGDPNRTNDTSVYSIISRYHPAAPADQTISTNYASNATFTPTAGVNTWQVYNNNSAPRRSSTLYWFADSLGNEPLHVGPSYSIDTVRVTDTVYVRQRRAMPIVRITQVEIMRTAATVGLTSPMPYWMEGNRKAAVQLTNVGDATAYLEGDTLMTVSPSSSLNNKVYTFGNVKIEPGQSLVVQYVGNGVTDSSLTIRSGLTPSFSWNSNVAFVYKRNGVVEDALPFNAVITTASTQSVSWSSLGVPSYVWNGEALAFENNTAGVIRTGFSGTINDWELSTSTMPMSIGSTNPSWIRYEDYGCEGDMAKMIVNIQNPPTVDLEVGVPMVAEGCDLGEEDVTVNIHNYGSDTVSNVVLNYCAGADTVSETLTASILPYADTNYTFAGKLNLAFGVDSTVTVCVWVNALPNDPLSNNDTNRVDVHSMFTPAMPDSIAGRVVLYATRDTLVTPSLSDRIPVWYDYDFNVVDTGYTHVTEVLYANGTRGMAYLGMTVSGGQVGTGVTLTGNTAYPNPYQPATKYVKQQYIYSAHEMRTAGVEAGKIQSIAFYLDTMVGSLDSINFLNYQIGIGMTEDTVFATTSSWQDVTPVLQEDVFTLRQDDDHAWVTHFLNEPFVWDGVSSVVVQVSYELETAISSGVKTTYTSKTGTTLHKTSNSALSPSTVGFTGTGNKGNNRPNITFNSVMYGCVGPMMPYDVTVESIPLVDAAISWPIVSDTTDIDYNSCDSIAMIVSVRSLATDSIDTLTLYYYLDANAVDSTVSEVNIASGESVNLELFRRKLSPGRHSVTAIVKVEGDNITNNDTISTSFSVKFCGGVYTIASEGAADYPSFGAAIDTLNQVGITGSVIFSVAGGTYTEQVVLNNVPGSSDENTISFIGQNDSVLLTASTSQADNYVMIVDGVSNLHLQNIQMVARPVANNVNFANVLVMQNDSNIHIDDCYFKVKGTIANMNASCIVLQGNVADLYLVNSVMDSGYYSLRCSGEEQNYSSFHITNNTFQNFASGGINLRGLTRGNISNNLFRSGNSADNRGLIGIYLAETTDTLTVNKNEIYLVDERKGAKRGIQLENVVGTLLNPVYVVNNMIGTHGTDSKGLSPAKSAGIWIDSSSSYVNVYFNSVRVRGKNVTHRSTPNQRQGAANETYAFWCGNTPSNIQVLNNVFSNFSYGFAYYVSTVNTVTTSNYNGYYSLSLTPYHWVSDIFDLAGLQVENSDDANSAFQEPYFMANDNLHMLLTNFYGMGQYNPDVFDDIDDNVRAQVPGPTIGAQEMERLIHDMAVARIHSPELPESISVPDNIETDSVKVTVSFYNNGRSNENNIRWYAYIDGYETATRSATRNLGTFAPSQMKRDSVMVPTQLGIIDTQYMHVVLLADNDTSLTNNELTIPFYLAPAFNLTTMKVEATSTATPAGCKMYNTQISIQLKNDGSKPIPAGTSVKIGYHTEVSTPSDVVVPTLPDTVEQMVTFENMLPTGSTITFVFDSLANLYPTNNYQNIKVRIRGWYHYQYDIVLSNDSTVATSNSQSPLKDSYYTPAAPFGYDTTLAYGTWGAVRADQENTRPIRWYRDSTAAPFYSPSQYNASKRWSNTPQYFHDSTYYLNCLSDKNCPSDFSTVTVSVAPRKTRDVAIEDVLAPLGSRVYMENDTVRVRIANYGTATQSNIPVTYVLKRGNNVIQTVNDTVRETLATDQTCIFTFNTLLDIPTPTTAQNYSLNIWTDLTNDATRRNDTIRTLHTFSSLAQERYTNANNFDGYPSSENTRFDITRITFNSINLDLPPLNRAYTNLAEYDGPEYPVIHVTRGLTDSLIVQIQPLDATEMQFRARATVAIDYNRDGLFADVPGGCTEMLADADVFYSDSIYRMQITIPECASLGYMRMRVKMMGYIDESTEGHIVDFLLFVDEEQPAADFAITQIVSPRNRLLTTEDSLRVSFRVFNYGQTPISNPMFNYYFHQATDDSLQVLEYAWPGIVAPNTSAVVTLPAILLNRGTADFAVWSTTPGDTNTANDTLHYEYHRFHVVTATTRDDFENVDMWYAPTGFNAYTRNYWQRGMPNKARIDTTYSGVNAWVTSLNNNIISGKRGSVSYLYSPVVNTARIRIDTISFRLRRNLTSNSNLTLEYYNYEGKWMKVEDPNITTWYNDVDNQIFNGTSTTAEGYREYHISAQAAGLTGEFPENLQFRFVYTTPMGSTANSAFGEGCAVDDFVVGRAIRAIDPGVIAIVQPEHPQFGRTYYPEVAVMNYGYDTLRSVTIAYTHYGTYLPKETLITCAIPPHEVDTFAFTTPFTITSDYPDSFYITAYTRLFDDLYNDNDTASRLFFLSPLDNDISAEELVAPLDHVVAGDSNVRVTLRVRNFGNNPIYEATASYILNGVSRVDEHVDFMQLLGRPLQPLEYYNYTFQHRIYATMGIMRLTGIIKSPSNEYIYNDTVSKRVEGIMSITDVAATSINLLSVYDTLFVNLTLENRGARGVNNFEVGYWIDNDTTTMVRETYYRAMPLPALNTGTHTFRTVLPNRPSGYQYVSAYVHVAGDNDSSNDTTDVRSESFYDLEVLKVVVEENSNNDCRVLLQMRNNGNVFIHNRQIKMRAVINGSDSITTNFSRDVMPGETFHWQFSRRIPKSPIHQYVGSGWIAYISGDANPDNDQTNIVEVINYAEGTPTVNGDNLVLEQNYPNPFTQQTTIPFTLPNAARVNFFVMDAMGHIVYRDEQFFQSGDQSITINMEDYSAGVYYYGIEVDGQRQMRKMILR